MLRRPTLPARAAARAVSLAALAALFAAPARADDKPDLAVVNRIKAEAFQNGKVMEHLFQLTDVNGPRLTNSPGYHTAAEWTLKTLREWGAAAPHEEKWGTFGRGWWQTHFSIQLVEPVYAPLQGMPRAWTSGTAGPVTADAVYAPLFVKADRDDALDLDKLRAHVEAFCAAQKGKLRGKFVLFDDLRELEQPKEIASVRYDDAKLAALALAPEPAAYVLEWPLLRVPADPAKRFAFFSNTPLEVLNDFSTRRREIYKQLYAFLRDEGAVATLHNDTRGDGGIVFAESGGTWELKGPVPPPSIALTAEAYNRVARLVQKQLPVKLELDLRAQFTDEAAGTDGQNVVAQITGGKKKDEVVLLGAHLDSWHTGTGASDNAAGSAVALEAFRILKSLNLPMDRTVRLVLWSGEEQGLLGSRGYVKEHFGDPLTMQLKPEHAKVSAYFNLDNGSGKIRGIYLQGNDMARPIFEQWLAPFRDQGAATVTIRNTGSTDHVSFDAVGLPAFQFIQDGLDYDSRVHHSELDVYDHARAPDLMQASAILATFVYQAATRPELLPRKPLPKALPPKSTGVAAAQ